MAVRSKRLWAPTTVLVAGTLLYTSPAAETTLIKHLSIFNTFNVAQVISMYIGAIGTPQEFFAQSVPGQTAVQLPGLFIVLQPGDQLRAQTVTGSMVVTGFGAQLEGVAD